MIGLTIEAWWNLTPKEALKYFSAYAKRTDQELKKMDVANFILGKYVMYAINDPKHYPDKPILQDEQSATDEDENPDEMTDADRARLDALFGALAAKSNKLPSPTPEPPQNGSEKPTEQKL